jgi:ribosomal protein S18 acetylase RimI-like enzyme
MNRAAPSQQSPHILRPCRAADADFVVALTEAVMRGHSERTWGRFDPDFHRAAFHAAFGRLEHSIIVCDGVEAGYLALDHRADAEYLQWLLLSPAFQKRGIGSGIVAGLIGAARAAGKPVRLRILPVNNGAQRLYERLGFAVTGHDNEFVTMEHPAGAASL